MIGLILLVVVVAFLVWLLLKVPMFQASPFREIMVGIGVLIIVVACLDVLFGISLLAEMRKIGGK